MARTRSTDYVSRWNDITLAVLDMIFNIHPTAIPRVSIHSTNNFSLNVSTHNLIFVLHSMYHAHGHDAYRHTCNFHVRILTIWLLWNESLHQPSWIQRHFLFILLSFSFFHWFDSVARLLRCVTKQSVTITGCLPYLFVKGQTLRPWNQCMEYMNMDSSTMFTISIENV